MSSDNEPTGQLSPQPWMMTVETGRIVEALRSGGAEIRYVGGCVRDSVAKRPVTDIDIATTEEPETVMERLQAADIKAIPTGIAHGTVTAVLGEHKYEITTLRVDIEALGRHARVRFTDDWEADAARRDFTINTLSCTPEGAIYDPFGGLDDLGHGRICFVGNARVRIEEDVLRLLRFFRFYGTHGRPPPNIEALLACRELAPMLSELSGERIREEFFRILLVPHTAEIVGLMRGEHVVEHLLPDIRADNLGRLRLMSWLETNAMRVTSVSPDPIRRIAALLATDVDGGNRLADRLKLSNEQRERLLAMIARPVHPTADTGDAEYRRQLYDHGGQAVRDLALMAWADELAIAPRQSTQRTEAWLSLMRLTETWERPRLPVGGDDISALGITPGPRTGSILRVVEDWWKEGDFEAEREACLARLIEAAQQDGTDSA